MFNLPLISGFLAELIMRAVLIIEIEPTTPERLDEVEIVRRADLVTIL